MMIFISGGVRSGKSTLGERMIEELALGGKVYLATSKHYDSEMTERIHKHQESREKKGYRTIEKSDNLADVVGGLNGSDSVLLDCLGTLVANEMFYDYLVEYDDKLKEEMVIKIFSALQTINALVANFIVISNDVFSDGITYDRATKSYIEVLGKLHVKIAAAADRAIECVFGNAVVHKGDMQLASNN